MRNEDILMKLAEVKKGRYVKFTKIKDFGFGVIKESDMVIRLGVDFANMKINSERVVGELPWGHWVEGLENLVIEHKGNYYLRITSTDPANPESGADVIATRYLLDGVQVAKKEVLEKIGEAKVSTSASSVYNIKFDNIIRIGK